MNDKPKCEDIGFEHAWEDITPNIIYATYPPIYPPQVRRCMNCGRKETLTTIQSEITEWQSQPTHQDEK